MEWKNMKHTIKFIMLTALLLTLAKSYARAELVDMHDGTIYDNATQLSWQKAAGAGGVQTWDKAVAWAASLNAGKGFAGLKGWRLPATDTVCGAASNCTKS